MRKRKTKTELKGCRDGTVDRGCSTIPTMTVCDILFWAHWLQCLRCLSIWCILFFTKPAGPKCWLAGDSLRMEHKVVQARRDQIVTWEEAVKVLIITHPAWLRTKSFISEAFKMSLFNPTLQHLECIFNFRSILMALLDTIKHTEGLCSYFMRQQKGEVRIKLFTTLVHVLFWLFPLVYMTRLQFLVWRVW